LEQTVKMHESDLNGENLRSYFSVILQWETLCSRVCRVNQ